MSQPGVVSSLADLLGDEGVSTDPKVLARCSVDSSGLSPILAERLPAGAADLVAFPRSAEELARTVALAVRSGIPVTIRGKGTGNYGQGIPTHGGIVIDTTRARVIQSIEPGRITAEAGASLAALEQAANAAGQQLLMYPSTAHSTVGGFLAGGSGGTGSVRHGMLHTGFALALDVVYADGSADLVHLEGPDTDPFIHNYGTAGVIARATVALEPLQDWHAFYASYSDFHDAFHDLRRVAALEPTPRLVSADPPTLAGALPRDPAVPAGRASLRAILDAATVEAATEIVVAGGGRVEAVRSGPRHTMRLSTISYNHPITWLQRAASEQYFHVEVSGDAIIDRVDELHTVYPGAMLHLEAQKDRPIGMVAAPYESAEQVYAGFERLTALGIGFHNPHQWFVDHEPQRTRELAARTDPHGLLNPGKLFDPSTSPISSRP